MNKIIWSRWIPILTLFLLFVLFSSLTEVFLTDRNLTNLARQVSVNCILGFGMTFIILLGAIDLSIGSLLALGAVVGALAQQGFGFYQGGWPGAILCALIVCAVCASFGSFTGFMVSRFKIPSFVVSLGLFVIARGLALIFSGGSRIGPLSEEYRLLGTGFLSPTISLVLILAITIGMIAFELWKSEPGIGKWIRSGLCVLGATAAISIFYGYQGIPVPVLVMVFILAGSVFLLDRTIIGRYLYAIGGNPEAARLCGVRSSKVYFFVYSLMGILVGISALIESGRIDAGDPNAGNLYELDAIAAVVIGGTSLQGGVGHVWGTLLGALLMGTLNNGMSLLNVQTNQQMVIKGFIIIVAVWMDVVSKNRK